MGLATQYPEILDYVISRLKPSGPYNRTTFLSAFNSTTLAGSATAFAFNDISQYFIGGFDDLLNSSLVRKAINSDGMMGYHGVPQMPLFIYKALADLISPIADTDKLVSFYCNIGANILYRRNTVGGHSAEAYNGHPAAEQWLNAVLDGSVVSKYPTEGCLVENVFVNITTSPLRRRELVGSFLLEDS